MNREFWKPIVVVNGQYEVSNFGNVRNTKTRVLLKQHIHTGGYLYVTIGSRKTKRICKSVHRLVAIAFCENYSKSLVVNHKDGNKLNNNADNLDWVTQAENVRHAIDNKLIDFTKRNYQTKQVLCVELNTIFTSTQEASKKMNISQGNISSACNGKRKQAGGFTWRFIDHFSK